MGLGHACGVRVHKVQRVQKVQRERFLGLTGLTAGGFLSLTGPLAPRVVDCRSAAMLMKSALRIYLSVSNVTQYPVPPIFSFPLEGKSREAGKGVRGRAPIGCSIAVLTANRRPPERSDAQNVVSRFPFRGSMSIIMPPFGGHVHIEYHNHSYPRTSLRHFVALFP